MRMLTAMLAIGMVFLAATAFAAEARAPRVEMGQPVKTGDAPAEPKPAPDIRRRLEVVRATTAPAIDGKIDDAAWQAAAPLRDFSVAQAWNDESVPQLAADQTEARVLFDDKGLYVAVRAYQDPATIYTTIKENGWLRPDTDWQMRQEPWANSGCDEIEIAIDPELTRTAYYLFQVNPDGVKRTHYMPSARMYDGKYKRIDPVLTNDDRWQAAATRDDKGWCAEVFIPYACIGMREMGAASAAEPEAAQRRGRRGDGPNVFFDMVQDATVMGININRVSHKRHEASSWSVSRGPVFFRDAENFAAAYFRPMACSLEQVAIGDVFRGDDTARVTVRSRSDAPQDVMVRLAVSAEGAEGKAIEERVTVAPGATQEFAIAFERAPAGMQTVDVQLINVADNRLMDRAKRVFDCPPAVEVTVPKGIVYEGERDLYATVSVNAPGGVDGLACRITGKGAAVEAGTLGKLERGRYMVPLAVSDLPQGKYEVVFSTNAPKGGATEAFAAKLRVIESPYALSLYGTAGAGDGGSGVPDGFGVLGTTIPEREANEAAREELMTLPKDAGNAQLPFATDEMKARGYVTFAATPTADFASDILPRQAQIGEPLRAFAAGGEYEPICIGLHALTNLSGISIAVSEFKNASGAVLGSEQLDVRAERTDGLLVKPETLLTLEGGKSRRYFVTAYVAPGTAAGLYEGTATIAAADRPSETRGVSLLVLPFALSEPPLWYSIYGGTEGSQDPERDYITFKDLRAHGLDNLTCERPFGGSGGATIQHLIWDLPKPTGEGYMPDNPGRWDLALDEQFFKFHKEVNCRGPIIIDVNYLIRYMPCTEENAEGFRKAISQIEAKREEYGLAEFAYHLVDEPNNHYTYDDGRYGRRYGIQRVEFYGRVLHDMGLRVYETMNSGARGYEIAMSAFNEIDIWCPNSIYDGALIEYWRDGDRETWLYNYGGDGAVKGIRSTYGLYPLAIGATGVTQWVHRSYTFWNDSERKYVNTARWEAIREGVDDARYLVALDEAISRAKLGEGQSALDAAAALEELSAILDAYPAETDAKVAFEQTQDPEQWNKWRWLMASWILKLEGKGQ